LKLVFKLNIWESVLVDGSTHSSNDECLSRSSYTTNQIIASNFRLLPVLSVIDTVGVWEFFDMESILFSGLLLSLLLKGLHLGVS
jgi:hypothetical protein